VLSEIGFADAVLARETPDGLELIDGHARQAISGDQPVPVLVLDVTEAEADALLASLDPLAGLAGTDEAKLAELLDSLQTQSDAVREFWASLTPADALPTGEGVDPHSEWQGMPEFQHEDQRPFRTIHVHFENEQAVQDFARRLGQTFSDQARYVWHPQQVRSDFASQRYVS
jgi:hypothetical protein